MPATGFTGQLHSAFPPANALFNPMMALNQTQAEQTIGQNEIEMMARAAGSLLALPTEEARAAAYPDAVARLQQNNFARNAPSTYPGEATMRRLQLMGTSSEKQAEWQSNLAGNRAMLGGETGTGTGTTTPQPGTGAGGGGGGGGEDIYNLPKDQFLQAIAKRESGGDPTVLNYVAKADPTAYQRGATASGKYQMVNSTWLTAAKAAGIDTNKYPTARDAPEALQDQAASALYDMQGTAPWNPSKWGSNWVKGAGGGYTLQTTGGGGGGGTSTTAAATPPGATTPPAASTAPPASPFGAGAFAPPTRTVAAAPATTASAPNVPTNLIPPVNSPQMVAAQAVAARTGKPAPIEGSDGLFALPGGGVRNAAGGLVRSAAADAVIEGQQTAATTLSPQGAVVAAGPAAGGGAVPVAPAEAPASAFGGGAFATPPPNMLAPGAPGAPAPAAAVPPVAQNQVAPAAPAATAPAPAPTAPAVPQQPRLQTLDADNLTPRDRAQLRVLAEQRGMTPAVLQQRMQQMGQANLAAQERALADYDRAQAAARAQQAEQRQQAAAEETRRQHQIENERAAATARIQQQQEVRAQEKFDQERVEANRPYPGKSVQDTERNILIAGSQPGGDPSSIAYRNAYESQKYHTDINGNTIVRKMGMFEPPRAPGGAGGADAAPTVTKSPSVAPDKAREGMLGNASGQIKIVKALDELEAYPAAVGGMNVQLQNDYFLQRRDPQGVAARQAVANIQNHLFHELAGTAQSPAEAERLKPFAPNIKDTYSTLQTKLKGLLDINRETMLQAYRTYGPDAGGVRLPVIEEAIIDSIPPAAIEHLRGDTEKGREARFDKIFGKGAAKLVLSNG